MKTHEELLECSSEDRVMFEKITKGLPSRDGYSGNYIDSNGSEIPYGSEAHVLKHIRSAIEIVQPESILEIGLNRGHGAAMFLALSKATVLSLDISDRRETLHAGMHLKHQYGSRFDFIINDSGKVFDSLRNMKFDMCFVDGAHDEESVVKDILLCRDLDIPYLLMDDCYPRYGDVLKAIGRFDELQLVMDMDNIRLYKAYWQ